MAAHLHWQLTSWTPSSPHATNKQTPSNNCVVITLSCKLFHFISLFTTKWFIIGCFFITWESSVPVCHTAPAAPPCCLLLAFGMMVSWRNLLCCMVDDLLDDSLFSSAFGCLAGGIIPVLYGSKLSKHFYFCNNVCVKGSSMKQYSVCAKVSPT